MHGIRACIDAGVHSIEHCSWVDAFGRWGQLHRDLPARIASAGIFVSPTVPASWGRSSRSGLRNAMAPCYQYMLEAGVRFIASTDAGAIPNVFHHQLLPGLMVFGQAASMTAPELLRAATSEAAAACKLDGEVGCLIEGHSADILVVPGNVLDHVEYALNNLIIVVCRGRRIQPCPGFPPRQHDDAVPACPCSEAIFCEG